MASIIHPWQYATKYLGEGSVRNKDQKLVGQFLKIGHLKVIDYCSIEIVEIWLTKMDFS